MILAMIDDQREGRVKSRMTERDYEGFAFKE
jgi:hypothetical protein